MDDGLKTPAYIYPAVSADRKHGLFNPYINDFCKALEPEFEFVNAGKTPSGGILDIFGYLFGIKAVFFNWIEKLPGNRFGTLQMYLFFFLIALLRARKIKVIWTMHNKLSHDKAVSPSTEKIFRFMLKKSDLIITHSSEGRGFADELVPGSSRKVFFKHHPAKDRRNTLNPPGKEIDVLIWGTISPYKGIEEFLRFLNEHSPAVPVRLHITGKAVDKEYFAKLSAYRSEMVTIEDTFLSDEELRLLIGKSRLVLFTYSSPSILSSGALMDTLGYGARVIGPHKGAFADLSREGVIKTFHTPEEAVKLISESLKGDSQETDELLDKFLRENSWTAFANGFFSEYHKRFPDK
ncbi:MAG: glycosyltransferase [Bacteroidales bacterium]